MNISDLFRKKKPVVPPVEHYCKQIFTQTCTNEKLPFVEIQQFFRVYFDATTGSWIGETEITEKEYNEGILKNT